MTTLLLALSMLVLPVFPAGSILLLGLTYIAHCFTNPTSDVGEIILFFGAIGGVISALMGW